MEPQKTDIVIIGAGLTGLTLAYYLKKEGKNVTIVEEKPHIGGVINTLKEAGFIFETGPNTGVIGTPELVGLFNDLGSSIKVTVPDKSANNRWIWKNGRWCALPNSLLKFIRTPLFSVKDKLGIFLEPFRKPGNNPDEPLAQMVKRRLGKSYLTYAVDPFISGVYAGDPDLLITRYALPKLYHLEQNYGSFIRGAIKKRKEPKNELEKKVTREVFSVEGGLYNLITALNEKIGPENIITNAGNVSVNKDNAGYSICYRSTDNIQHYLNSKYVVITTSGNRIQSLIPFVNKQLIEDAANVSYAKVIQVVACYKKWEGIKLNAFGGLVPSIEKRDILGILFPSSLFAGRAPKDGAILSIFLGGVKNEAVFEKSDNDIEHIVLNEIKDMLHCILQPDFLKIYRYQNAIPQYELSTGKRLKAIAAIEGQYPGLIIAGNSRDGIGMADRVKQARQIAGQIITNYGN